MKNQLEKALLEADPTQMCRLPFSNDVLFCTSRVVYEVFPNHATGNSKKNAVCEDPDNVGKLVHLRKRNPENDMFVSLFFRGIIPVADVIRGNATHNIIHGRNRKKFRNRENTQIKKPQFFSLAFNPKKIHRNYSVKEMVTAANLLGIFGDGDHDGTFCGDGDDYNVVTNESTGYFYDFILGKDEPTESEISLRYCLQIKAFLTSVRCIRGGGIKHSCYHVYHSV